MAWRRLWTFALAAWLWGSTAAAQAESLAEPAAEPLVQPAVEATVDAPSADELEIERGVASWYGARFRGRAMADGQPHDPKDLTAAHRTLPIGSVVRVRHLANGREVVVRISDRGPHVRGRLIDLSRAAAAEIGMLARGVAQVALLREPAP